MAFNFKLAETKEELGPGTKLNGVGSHGKIPEDPDFCIGFVQEAERNPVWLRKGEGRRLKCRMKPAQTCHKIGMVTPGYQDAHFSFKCDVEDPRIVERCKKPQMFFVKFYSSDEIDFKND